jgi:hypothetical protein
MIVGSVYDVKKDPKKKDKCGLQRKREEVYIGKKKKRVAAKTKKCLEGQR